jgi:hypothetical protein
MPPGQAVEQGAEVGAVLHGAGRRGNSTFVPHFRPNLYQDYAHSGNQNAASLSGRYRTLQDTF